MGRASNRKKAQRRAGPGSRQARPRRRADAATRQAMRLLAGALQTLVEEGAKRKERVTSARRIWCSGADPVPAEPPHWPEDSLGDRFFGGTSLDEARAAPSLLTAKIPDPAVISADPGHWNVAMRALIRAVALEGLAVDHPAVRMLTEVLASIAETELAYGKAWRPGPTARDRTWMPRSRSSRN